MRSGKGSSLALRACSGKTRTASSCSGFVHSFRNPEVPHIA